MAKKKNNPLSKKKAKKSSSPKNRKVKKSPVKNKKGKKGTAKKKTTAKKVKTATAKIKKAVKLKKVVKKPASGNAHKQIAPQKPAGVKKQALLKSKNGNAEKPENEKPVVKTIVLPVESTKKPQPKAEKQKKSSKAEKARRVIVTQPVYPHYNKPLVKSDKEPKGKFSLEYVVHASSQILYEFLSTPSGLSEWFADDVNVTKDYYTFIWNGQEQQARIQGMKDEKYIRFQWAEKDDGSYFEFKIETDELTGDVSLIITDFSDESERESSRLLWDSQVERLLKVLGSY